MNKFKKTSQVLCLISIGLGLAVVFNNNNIDVYGAFLTTFIPSIGLFTYGILYNE